MTRNKVFLLSLFVLLGVASCRREPIQLREPPQVPLAEEWSTESGESGEVLSEWWREFGDNRLDQLVDGAITGNFNLQAAAARVERAASQARIAGAGRLPQVSASADGSRRRQNFIGFPIPGAERNVLSRTFTSFGVSLDVSWEVDLWGRISAGEWAALADLEAVRADFRGGQISLAGQTSKAWFAVVESLQQVRLAKNTVASYQDTVDRVRSRYRQGLQSSLDLRLALSSLSSAEALLQQREQQLDGTIRQLEILLGEYPGRDLQPESTLPELPESVPAGLPSQLLGRRPDLVSAEKRLLAADARWVQARKNLLPRLSLTGSFGTASQRLRDVVSGDFWIWSVLGNVVQPIFEGGRLRAEVSLNDAESREALAVYIDTALRAFAEVESALAAENYLAERETALGEAARQASASEELSRDRYTSGLEPFVTVLEAQRSNLTAQSQLLELRRLRLDNRVDLHIALGGGFESDSESSKESEEVPVDGE